MTAFYFAYADEGDAFNPATMDVEDEQILAFELSQEEGDFASLKIDVLNPKVGLLGAGRNLWCWFSWDNGSGVTALFNGRLIGIPRRIDGEVVELEFVARPADYQAQKKALADSLKVLPFHDEMWISEGAADPDAVLEGRSAALHVHRTTLAVTISDILVGEDGTLDIAASEHFYDDFDLDAETPLRRVIIKLTAKWTQAGAGTIDLTRQLWDAFAAAGSPTPYPLVASLTGEGLLGDWPKPLDEIGGGWTVAADNTIEDATWFRGLIKSYIWVKPILTSEDNVVQPGTFVWVNGSGPMWQPEVTETEQVITGYEQWSVLFPAGVYKPNFTVSYDAERTRTETVTMILAADVQPLLVDPNDDEEETLELSSDFTDQPVDDDEDSPAGAVPIGDARRNSYFLTDRGQQSVQNGILQGRARLAAAARAVKVKCKTQLGKLTGVTCRWNATVHDDRLPGGVATGKITKYALKGSGDDGEFIGELEIGCTIGRGGSVSPAAGTGDYVEDGYVEDGYQTRTGQTFDAGYGDVTYQTFSDITVLDDDGIDLLSMTARSVLNSITVDDGITDQKAALAQFTESYDGTSDPPAELALHPTIVTLDLKPITGRSFSTAFAPTLSLLKLPKTIDLEAA